MQASHETQQLIRNGSENYMILGQRRQTLIILINAMSKFNIYNSVQSFIKYVLILISITAPILCTVHPKRKVTRKKF